jgi:cyclase
MLRPRITPCLLVHKNGLVKTRQFTDPKYVGDPLNAVRIFNEKEVDEIVVLDIDATAERREPDYGLIANLAAECRMPLCYGGGVRTPEQVERIIGLGVEKVAISAAAVETPDVVRAAAKVVGNQSVAVVMDVRRNRSGACELFTHNGRTATGQNPIDFARRMVDLGAGEIVVNSIDRDGMMQGYDLELARAVRTAVGCPMTVLGGAGSLKHIQDLIREVGILGAAAGSLFVFKGVYRAVLISYPRCEERDALIPSKLD